MMTLREFYEGKTVLITGHTGFKGSWLVAWLKLLGARVIGYALSPEQGRLNMFEAANIDKNMLSVLADIRDLSSVVGVMKKHAPDIVFHLAAQALVRRSYIEPVETYATNVMGTINILEAARQTPSVRAIVVITSDKCYENSEWVWGYRETDPLGGYDPYSSSKGCAEFVTQAYYNSFFKSSGEVSVASARAGNVIGGGDWAEDRLVPDIIRAIAANESVVLRYPNAIRPWQHVLEPLRGYLMLGERLWDQSENFSGAWNFGPHDDEVLNVRLVTEKIIKYWGRGELLISDEINHPHEANYLKLDCSKAHSILNWYPLLTVDEALQMTTVWYQTYLENPVSAGIMTEQQISEYMNRFLQ